MATTATAPAALRLRAARSTPVLGALAALARRRAALTAGNPRQIAVPLLTPILFATVIAPALKAALGGLHTSVDYTAFVAVGTVGLLVPLAATVAGLSGVRGAGLRRRPRRRRPARAARGADPARAARRRQRPRRARAVRAAGRRAP